MDRLIRAFAGAILLSLCVACSSKADKEPLFVFAAASLDGPLDSLASQYIRDAGVPVLIAYGASGSLAQQIRAGADVDLFISADTGWVIRLAEEKNSPILRWLPFLHNRLVLVTSSDLDHRTRAFGPLDGPAVGKIAIADPEAAPAGRYARAYLQKTGVWDSVQSKLVIQEDVRGVVNAVRLGVADVGLVYQSDASLSPHLRIVEEIADSLYPPVIYGMAILKGSRASATGKFVDFLLGPDGRRRFEAAGFIVDSSKRNR